MPKRDYDDPVYKRARAAVLKRDGRKCQMPKNGKICHSRRRLNVHHIMTWSKFPSLRYSERNLITLCRTCHDKLKDREHHYIPLLQDIVSRKYRD